MPHAGELSGPEAVRAVIAALNPHRLGHGVRIAEDPATSTAVAAAGIVCDVCPTSNVILGVSESFAAHPLPRLLDSGVRVTLNADDPLLFGTSLGEEYSRARREFGLSDDELAGIAGTSVDAAAAPANIKAAAREAIAAWLS